MSADERRAISDLLDRAARLVVDRADGIALAAPVLQACALAEPLESDAASTLTTAASIVRNGESRPHRQLVSAVRAVLLLADRTGQRAEISAAVLGRAAFHGALRMPFDRRAVLNGHTVRATDAEWSFGTGPVLEATAEEIVRFIVGISDTPPGRT